MRKQLMLIAVASAFVIGTALAQLPTKSKSDAYEIVTVDTMPIPPPSREVQRAKARTLAIGRDDRGHGEEDVQRVANFYSHFETVVRARGNDSSRSPAETSEDLRAGRVYSDLSELKLATTPAIFTSGTLVAATPAGTMQEKGWTGVERFYQIDGVGKVRLTQYDLGLTGGKFYMMKEYINSSVRGKHAISKVFVNDNNQSIEEVVWVSGSKFFMLTFAPETPAKREDIQSTQAAKGAAASEKVSAVVLANQVE